jgi:hypothetical protein
MNQNQVQEKLSKLYDCKEVFTVIFSGKKSGKANGIYKPLTREIVIHNRNFIDDEHGKQNDMLLMFTAIHELTHHVLITEKGNKSPRTHSQEFWATFHNLLDIAEEKQIYKAQIDSDTKQLISEARDISKQIAQLQRELGRILLAINDSCQENGLRYEDIVEREAQIDRQSAKIAVSALPWAIRMSVLTFRQRPPASATTKSAPLLLQQDKRVKASFRRKTLLGRRNPLIKMTIQQHCSVKKSALRQRSNH